MSAEKQRDKLAITDAMRAILDAVSDGVVVMDAERHIVFLNRTAQELLDCGAGEGVGARCSDVLNTTDCENNCPLTRLEQRGEPAERVEMVYRGRRGREVIARSSFERLRDASGDVVGSVEVFHDLRDVRRLEGQLYGRRGLGRLVGKSCLMRQLYEVLETTAQGADPVLITGEAGAGKEAVARAIHELGPRAERPFVLVNCAALGRRSLDKELFGAADGAGVASGGTILLDEVDRLTSSAQRVVLDKLLAEAASMRLMAATARDIEAAVEREAFERELFFRLNAFPVNVPPLRERAEDVPLLVEHFLRGLNQRSRTRYVEGLAPDAMDVLCGHDFPGNVRELEHAIEHAFTRCRGKTIRLDHLPPTLTVRAVGPSVAAEADDSDSVEILERDFMLKVLDENSWRLNTVAEQLNLSRTTLWRKMRRLGIENPRRST
jgi:PAS domain S-box-containing protein